MGEYRFIKIAKQYFCEVNSSELWDELRFLIGDHMPDEYYNYCAAHLQKPSLKSQAIKILSHLARIK